MRRSRLTYVVPGVAFVAAAVYVLIYLFRWEWPRAIVAGVFMLAVEVGIGFSLVLGRLAAMEERLDRAERDAAARTKTALRETAPSSSEPFAWLSDGADRMSVFVPILLGAGFVLSALAWAVERLARLTSLPTLERALVLRLQPLTMPEGTLLGAAPRTLPPLPYVAHPRSLRWVSVVIGVLLAVPVGLAFDSLQDATQNRPDVIVPTSEASIVISIDNRQGKTANPVAAATALWGGCFNQIGPRYRLIGIEGRGGDIVELQVRPAIGKYAERRLRGCFEDATIDLVRAEVLSITAL